MDTTKAKLVKWALFLVLLCVLLVAFIFIRTAYRVGMRQIEAELRSRALTEVCQAVVIYMNEHEGRWPASWEDLATIQTSPEVSDYDLHQDYSKIKEFVTIDFSADPADLVGSTPSTFTAIKPNGYIYGSFYDFAYGPLIEKIEEYYGGNAPEPKPTP